MHLHTFDQHYLQVGDPALTRGGGRCGRSWKFIGGDAARVPVGPEDAVGFDMQVHRIDTHTGIALEGLLIMPVGHAGVQAADFIVVGDVENLSTAVHACKRKENKITRMAVETKVNNYGYFKKNQKRISRV